MSLETSQTGLGSHPARFQTPLRERGEEDTRGASPHPRRGRPRPLASWSTTPQVLPLRRGWSIGNEVRVLFVFGQFQPRSESDSPGGGHSGIQAAGRRFTLIWPGEACPVTSRPPGPAA